MCVSLNFINHKNVLRYNHVIVSIVTRIDLEDRIKTLWNDLNEDMSVKELRTHSIPLYTMPVLEAFSLVGMGVWRGWCLLYFSL